VVLQEALSRSEKALDSISIDAYYVILTSLSGRGRRATYLLWGQVWRRCTAELHPAGTYGESGEPRGILWV